MRGQLESEFPENIYIYLNEVAHFDFAYADEWCERQLGPARYRINVSTHHDHSKLELRRVAQNGRWCYFANTYYFARARDAMLFRLSTT